jgi:hypothetical protein
MRSATVVMAAKKDEIAAQAVLVSPKNLSGGARTVT